MMRLSKPTSEQYSSVRNIMPTTFSLEIPIVDLSKPEAKSLIVKACEEFGFFKVINHGVPVEAISQLESEAFKFFSQPITEKEKVGMYPKKITEKEKVGTANPLGYGNKRIGTNGDVGWVEYLLLTANEDHNFSVHGKNTEKLSCLLNEYTCATRRMACEILELMAEGLKIQPKNVLSKLVMDKQSDSLFRVNHYPACPEMNLNGENLIGFGEHTDPQIISLLRSNNTSGLQISLRDGSWISVPPDHSSFFINVGDSLQVMTNGRFRSVRHRVLANGLESRLSMIYFGGPPLSEKIAPLPSLMKGKESLYKEFTWFEYKNSSYATRLADNRLGLYERIVAS